MRILHTIPGLSLNSGGPSTCTYHLLTGLNKMGVRADVLALSPQKPEEQIGTDDFIKFVPCDAFSPLLYSPNFKRYLKEHQNYDIYHANAIWSLPSHYTRLIAKEQNKPFVLATHGMLYPQALRISSWKKKLALPLFQRKDLEMTDCLQATCEAELVHIRQFGLKNPVAIVPNCLYMPILPTVRQKENSLRRFAFVGRIHRIKNIDTLIQAWAQLGSKTKEAELLIIGDGDAACKKELEQLAEKCASGNIRFTGFLHGKELQQITSSLDFQVLPSQSENFGMVVPEALIQGIPVIASKGTPWKELEIHRCGWWIDCNVNTLAETLEQALNLSEASRQAMGERGRQLVIDNFLVDKVAQKMNQLYEWLLGGEQADFVHS